MYFESRSQAGQTLAQNLFERYRYEDCAIIALSDGGVMVGEQVAAALHAVLTMLVVEGIEIPGEGLSFGGISQSGQFTYNSALTDSQIQGYVSEFHGYLEEQKREVFQRINRLVGDGGVIDPDLLRDRHVILVSDGLDDVSAIDAALDFLKPIRVQKVIVAAPVATIPVVDRLHVAVDEMHILDVKSNYLGVDHYYEENTIPSHEETIDKINQIILNWQ